MNRPRRGHEKEESMRKAIVIVASAALGFAAAGLGMASEDLAKKNGCMGCHDVAKKKAGPAFKDVAAKYKGQADAEGKLVAELGAGKKHPKTAASEADRKTLVKWVLSQ
jgi:cytochrome c